MSDPADGAWLSVSDLAAARKVSPAAISKRALRLEGLGLLHPRKGPLGAKLISVAEFERAIAATEDGVRAANGTTTSADPAAGPASPVLAREQARKTALEADIRQLDLDERLGQLLPVDEVRRTYAAAGDAMGRVLDSLPDRLDTILAAVAKDGRSAGRAVLRDVARDVRLALAKAGAELAAGARSQGEAL